MDIAAVEFLAVEDHELQRDVLLEILARLGATKVTGVADSRAALQIVAAPGASVDIIICDLVMPDMDGMELIRRLSETGTKASIILTSVLESSLIASVATMARAYGVTVLGIVEKPVTAAELDAMIKLYKPAQPNVRSPTEPSVSFELAEIMQGLERDEFVPFFQPTLDLVSGGVTGAEALARWLHPQKGIIQPCGFVEVLEDTGHIGALTWIMLRKSAAFGKQWRTASGLDVSVSVNISGKSLSDAHLAERVKHLVCGEGLEPSHMILELTESAATTDVGMALENLARLRISGFGLSIDDYGTGYSSLQQLIRIAFTELKIDRSFVTNAACQRSARVILEASLRMADELKITSVAEGVETQTDWDLLRELGCQQAQGYFIARPMEAGALLQWTGDRMHAFYKTAVERS